MAETKVGGGGHAQEAYDPATGKYVSEDKGSSGLEKYHTGSGLSSKDIEDKILNDEFGKEFSDYYKKASQEEKNSMIDYVHSEFDKANTENESSQRFTPLTRQEYINFRDSSIANSPLTQQDLNVIDHYVGTGSTSFYLNTAMRIGYDEMIKQFVQREGYNPNDRPGDYLSKANFEEFAKVMNKATHSFHAPRDMQVDRYVGTGPLVSWLKGTGILDGIPTENNGFHDRLQQGSYTLQDLASRLSNLIGSVMPKDGSFLSFSASPDLSHMKGKRGAKKKNILIKFDVPQGTDMMITGNTHESEGMFPNDLDFYVKDVRLEQDNEGQDRVVMYYGIKK